MYRYEPDRPSAGRLLRALVLMASGVGWAATSAAESQGSGSGGEEDVVELETYTAEETVDDDIGLLQKEPVDSVFGFGKTILDTPRSVSSINAEFLDEFDVTSINDIVNFVPGTFTTSFFGVAGSLDVRGTSAENYFRGVKRLNNEGNYPTPIGASDRIDVIRGPMSPISGPSKVGGALNFIPKSARAETGQYMDSPSGQVGYTTGSWGKNVGTAEIGGPLTVFGKSAGYYLYGEREYSDSYYENHFNRQTLLQGSFNVDLSMRTRIETGFMHQEWRGHENGGWNRLTQDLIDDDTYISGDPATNIDVEFGDGDGLIEESEIDAFDASLPGVVSDNGVTCFTGMIAFCQMDDGSPLDTTQVTQDLVDQLGIGLDPATVGTEKIDASEVLIADTDQYDTDSSVFYFDLIHEMDNGLKITNKLFYDSVEYTNVDGYGFTKTADSWVVEDKLIFDFGFEAGNVKADVQVSPSIRYTDAFYADDFTDELFDRVDLTEGFSDLSLMAVPTRQADQSWSNYVNSKYTQYGFATLVDLQIAERLNVVLGGRYDYVDIEADVGDGPGPVTLAGTPEVGATADDDGITWSASVNYALPGGIKPYVTMAEQTTIVSGSASDVSLGNVQNKTFLGDSELLEYGVKGNFLDGRLFAALAYFEQERIAFNAQNPVNNQATESEGYEAELRYVHDDRFSFIGTWSKLDVEVVHPSGAAFSYLGAGNIPQIDPASIFGGIIGAVHPVGTNPDRGGIPDRTWSFAGSQRWTSHIRTGFSFTSVGKTESSVTGGIELPSYEVLNVHGSYTTDRYRFSLYLQNVTDELYFRGNFPSLYGNNNTLPSQPFSWQLEAVYKF